MATTMAASVSVDSSLLSQDFTPDLPAQQTTIGEDTREEDQMEPEVLEPLNATELQWLSDRAKELDTTQGDQELSQLLLRLTSTIVPSSNQLHAQAQIINHLSNQRDFLLKRYEEERLLWETERDSWSRTSEVLLARSIAEGGRSRELQLEHRNNSVLSENTVLKQKLLDSNQRLQSLESEIAQLKPLLLMQPFALMHSHPSIAPPATARQPRLSTTSTTPSISTPTALASAPVPNTDTDTTHQTPVYRAIPFSPSKQNGDYYRHRSPILVSSPSRNTTKQFQPTTPKSSSTTAQSHNTVVNPSTPTQPQPQPHGHFTRKPKPRTMSADARSEHLLLAARKLGRQRATLLSGVYAATITPAPQSQSQPTDLNAQSHSLAHSTPLQAPPTFSPIFAPGSYTYPYVYPSTPPQKGKASSNAPTSSQHPTHTKSRINYYPNVYSKDRPPVSSPPKQGESSKTPQKFSTSNTTPSALENLLSAAQTVLSSPTTPTSNRRGSKRRKTDHQTPLESSPSLRSMIARSSSSRNLSQRRPVAQSQLLIPTAPVTREATRSPPTDSETHTRNRFSALDVLADQAAVFSHSQESDHSHGEDIHSEDEHPGPNPAPKGKARETVPENGSRESSHSSSHHSQHVDEHHIRQYELEDESEADADGEGDIDVEFEFTPSKFKDPDESHTQPVSSQSSSSSLAPPISLKSNGHSSSSRTHLSQSYPLTASATLPILPVSPPGATAYGSLSHSLPNLSTASVPLHSSAIHGLAANLTPNKSFIHHEPTTGKRTRSPYTKWTSAEDALLEQAVAKHGQKWDLVRKELPNRGYHQVRQRWLRKQGAFDRSESLPATGVGVVPGTVFIPTSPHSIMSHPLHSTRSPPMSETSPISPVLNPILAPSGVDVASDSRTSSKPLMIDE